MYRGGMLPCGCQVLQRVTEKLPSWFPGTGPLKTAFWWHTEMGQVVRARPVCGIPEGSSWTAVRVCEIHGQPWRHIGTIVYDEETTCFQVPDVQPGGEWRTENTDEYGDSEASHRKSRPHYVVYLVPSPPAGKQVVTTVQSAAAVLRPK